MKYIITTIILALSLSANGQSTYADRDSLANTTALKNRVSWAAGLVAANYSTDTTAKGWASDFITTEQKQDIWLLPMTRYVVQQAGGSFVISDASILSSVTAYYPTFAVMIRRKVIGK